MLSVYQMEITLDFLANYLISWQQPGGHGGSRPAEYTGSVWGLFCTGVATQGSS